MPGAYEPRPSRRPLAALQPLANWVISHRLLAARATSQLGTYHIVFSPPAPLANWVLITTSPSRRLYGQGRSVVDWRV
jgi:hypothetical protein